MTKTKTLLVEAPCLFGHICKSSQPTPPILFKSQRFQLPSGHFLPRHVVTHFHVILLNNWFSALHHHAMKGFGLVMSAKDPEKGMDSDQSSCYQLDQPKAVDIKNVCFLHPMRGVGKTHRSSPHATTKSITSPSYPLPSLGSGIVLVRTRQGGAGRSRPSSIPSWCRPPGPNPPARGPSTPSRSHNLGLTDRRTDRTAALEVKAMQRTSNDS